jgi:hypothetical protein
VFLLLLSPAIISLAGAEDRESAEADKRLIQLAREKMEAAIRLDARVNESQGRAFQGVFISKEGLALIDLSSLVWKEKPTAVTAVGTRLKLGRAEEASNKNGPPGKIASGGSMPAFRRRFFAFLSGLYPGATGTL